MINEENHKKITDAVKASMFSAKNFTPNEDALAVFKNSGVSMNDFKMRQDIVDALHSKYPAYNFAKFDSDDQQLPDIFDELMRIHTRERIKKMSEQAVEQFHQAMASLPESRVLPVWMEINGVTSKVGDALIDTTENGFCILHAVIDGQAHTAALLRGDDAKFFVGNKEDFKKDS